MAKKPNEQGLIEKTKQRIAKLFGGKKTVKPTASEKQLITERLQKKYPQMFETGWGKPKKKGEPVYFRGVRRKSTKQQLKDAGITEKELKSLGMK